MTTAGVGARDVGAAYDPAARGLRWSARRFTGCFFLVTAGVHVGIVAADTGFYGDFASAPVMDWVGRAWEQVFMAAPAAWGLALALGELALALLLLRGGPSARVGWTGVIVFQVALGLFGWGFLFWTVPVLAFLVPAAVRDWPRLGAGGDPAD